MKNIACILLLLSTSNALLVTPTKIQCNKCISSIDYYKTHNDTIVNIFNALDKICNEFNIKECIEFTNYTKNTLEHLNATKLCENIGYCETLSMDKFIMNINNISLFRYYNSIIAMEPQFSLNSNSNSTSNYIQHMNFHQIWNITFNEPIINTNYYSNHIIEVKNYPGHCGFKCSIDLLKFTTDKHIYYFNISDSLHPSFIGRVTFDSIGYVINSNEYSKFWDLWSLQYNNIITDYYNKINISVIDNLYNGTMYTVLANWSHTYDKINSLKLIEWDIGFN